MRARRISIRSSRCARIARRLGLRVAPSSRDIARFMVGEPLQFTPGTQERYSNFGYVMLGLVAEKAGAGGISRSGPRTGGGAARR